MEAISAFFFATFLLRKYPFANLQKKFEVFHCLNFLDQEIYWLTKRKKKLLAFYFTLSFVIFAPLNSNYRKH